MLKIKISFLVMALLMLNSVGTAACAIEQSERSQNTKRTKNKNAPAKPTPAPAGETDVKQDEIKVLAEGTQSRMNDAFVAVARDPATYAALKSALAASLPEMGGDFFKSHAVVAAFLGQRNTGGYGVAVTRTGEGGIRISEKRPPKDAMVTQAFTTPFQVVSIPVGEQARFNLEMDNLWKEAMRPYRINEGTFEMTGGIAGRREQFQLGGDIRIAQYGNLVTFAFELKGTGGAAERLVPGKERLLPGVATGVKEGDGRVRIARLDAGSLVEEPNDGLRATGQLRDNESKLSLTFEPLPSSIADGFSGAGRLEAVATAPPKKRKPAEADVM